MKGHFYLSIPGKTSVEPCLDHVSTHGPIVVSKGLQEHDLLSLGHILTPVTKRSGERGHTAYLTINQITSSSGGGEVPSRTGCWQTRPCLPKENYTTSECTLLVNLSVFIPNIPLKYSPLLSSIYSSSHPASQLASKCIGFIGTSFSPSCPSSK